MSAIWASRALAAAAPRALRLGVAAVATRVSPCSTHHLRVTDGRPLYAARFAAVLPFHTPPGLAPAQLADTRLWMHIGLDGAPAYAERWKRAFGFYEGLASVCGTDGVFRHIDPEGRPAYSTGFAWAGNFQGGRCVVRDAHSDYFHIDAAGVRGTGPHAYCGDFREGAAVVRRREDGLCHHADPEGRPLLPGHPGFLDLDVFHKGFSRARDSRGWFLLSRDGKDWCKGRRYASVEHFYNGQALVKEWDGRRRVLSEHPDTPGTSVWWPPGGNPIEPALHSIRAGGTSG